MLARLRQYSARPRTRMMRAGGAKGWCGGRSPPPDTPRLRVFEVHIRVFEEIIQVFDDHKVRQKYENLVLGMSLPKKSKWSMGILYKVHKIISRKLSYMTRRDEPHLVVASVSRPLRSKKQHPKSPKLDLEKLV